jgi:hypothetical protein
MPYENDLVILVPDKNAHFLFHGVFSKAVALGLRPTTVQLDTHPLRDSGCLDADEILQSQAQRYAHAMVVVADHSRSGRPEMPRGEMEAAIEHKLAQAGWGRRACAIVVEPGIGRWLLEHELGERWSAGVEELQRTVEAALRQRRLPQSPELYRELGARMVDEEEPDPAWQKILATLKAWFGAAPPERQEEQPSSLSRFEGLTERWLRDTRSASSFTAVVSHPAYQEIIRMGREVVPFILRDLEKEPKHWGPALQAITGAQPVPKEHAGRVTRIAEDWLRWARENGYAW